jgi:hypothetical protein
MKEAESAHVIPKRLIVVGAGIGGLTFCIAMIEAWFVEFVFFFLKKKNRIDSFHSFINATNFQQLLYLFVWFRCHIGAAKRLASHRR